MCIYLISIPQRFLPSSSVVMMASMVRQVNQCRNCKGSQSAARNVGMDMILNIEVSIFTPKLLWNTECHDSFFFYNNFVQ